MFPQITKLLLGLILLTPVWGQAAPVQPTSLSMKCVRKYPTTSFLVRTEGSEVILTTVHHNGTGYMPIHDGIIVPNDFPYLTEKSQLLTQMGDRNEFRFPINKCKIFDENMISCSSGETKKFNELEVTALSFHTSLIQTKAYGLTAEYVKVSVDLNINGYVPVQQISNDFYPSECEINPAQLTQKR